MTMSEDSRRARGIARYADQFGISEPEVEQAFLATFGMEFAEEAFQATGGAAWNDGPISLRERSLIVVAILAALGGVESRLSGHLRWALQHGATVEELRATLLMVANYAGFARASVALESLDALMTAVSAEQSTEQSEEQRNCDS
ncbi:MAG: carboxymuconolactone decarboxylase family protein [Actinomycetales bacterium]|nr:carboxymuconolactone decarboxylase family protein [Actinomycetales bacterium]